MVGELTTKEDNCSACFVRASDTRRLRILHERNRLLNEIAPAWFPLRRSCLLCGRPVSFRRPPVPIGYPGREGKNEELIHGCLIARSFDLAASPSPHNWSAYRLPRHIPLPSPPPPLNSMARAQSLSSSGNVKPILLAAAVRRRQPRGVTVAINVFSLFSELLERARGSERGEEEEGPSAFRPVYTRASGVCSFAAAPERSPCYSTPGNMDTRYWFPCKSAIGSESSRACLMNCDPVENRGNTAVSSLRDGDAGSVILPRATWQRCSATLHELATPRSVDAATLRAHHPPARYLSADRGKAALSRRLVINSDRALADFPRDLCRGNWHWSGECSGPGPCPPDEGPDSAACPPDSAASGNGTCSCIKERCAQPSCKYGAHRELRRRGSDNPGDCCDVYECVSSHSVWPALYECLQDIHGDSSPFLLQPFHELSNGFWPRLTSPHPAIQFVPKMFYRVEAGALGGLVQSANIVVGAPLHSSP
ncbi:hypothetical protein PR048_031339 [Dryococelus australis]|uniref:Uncharacterized protein n=1 Tax=Dryococelus australis TaxID=614101 RepID=A0ABQ9G7V3_9NEOP|nr:hypothetical protein PR048_031339 [Dryococelus australis]